MEEKSNVILQSERLESETDVLNRSQRRRIHRLYETGLSITRIAKEESIDRKTIYKILGGMPIVITILLLPFPKLTLCSLSKTLVQEKML